MLEAISKYQFLQNAIIAGILASIVCGIIGVIIVEKRLIMMSGGIAHTAYGGVGLGYLCGFTPIIGAMIFSVVAALGIGYVKKKNKSNSDIVIALFWSLGMALGVAFIGFMPGYPPDMNSYLFGNILSVTKADINAMLIMASVVILAILVFYNDWKAYLFDEEFSEIIGMKTNIMQYALLILIALTVVTLIRVVGIILVIALFTAPAAISAMVSKNLKNRMILSVLFGAFFCLFGLYISYTINIPSGATIIILSVLAYIIVFLLTQFKHKKNTV